MFLSTFNKPSKEKKKRKEMMNSHFFVRVDRTYTFVNTLVPVQKKTLIQFKGCQIISLQRNKYKQITEMRDETFMGLNSYGYRNRDFSLLQQLSYQLIQDMNVNEQKRKSQYMSFANFIIHNTCTCMQMVSFTLQYTNVSSILQS